MGEFAGAGDGLLLGDVFFGIDSVALDFADFLCSAAEGAIRRDFVALGSGIKRTKIGFG